jgi:hypothetical protein
VFDIEARQVPADALGLRQFLLDESGIGRIVLDRQDAYRFLLHNLTLIPYDLAHTSTLPIAASRVAFATLVPQDTDLLLVRVDENILLRSSGRQAFIQGSLVPVASTQHLLDDLVVLPAERLEPALPAQDLRMMRVALLALGQDR